MLYFRRIILLCFLCVAAAMPISIAAATAPATAICPEHVVDARFGVEAWLKKNSSGKYIVSFNSYEPDFAMEISTEEAEKYFKDPYALHSIYFKLEQKILESEGRTMCGVAAVFLEAEPASRSDISTAYDSACYTKDFDPITVTGTLTDITATADFDIIVVQDGIVSSDIVCSSEQAEEFFGTEAIGKQVSVTYRPRQMRMDSHCLRPFFIQSGTLLDANTAKTGEEAAMSDAMSDAKPEKEVLEKSSVQANEKVGEKVDEKKLASYIQTLQKFPKKVSPFGKYIDLAKAAYFKTFTLKDTAPNRQAGFEAFYAYYLGILAEISKDSDGFLKKLEKIANGSERGTRYAEKYGFAILRQNKGPFVVKIDPIYLQKTFEGYLTDSWTDYFAFESVNQALYVRGHVNKDDDLQKKKRALGKAFLEKYPDSSLVPRVKEAMKE